MADCTALQGPLSRAWYESNPTYFAPSVVDWDTAVPSEAGMNATLLGQGGNSIKRLRYLKSFLVARNGKLCYERYYNGAAANHADNIHSAHKSFLGTMVGIAIDKGMLSLDTTLEQALPSYVPFMSAVKKTIKIRHLLSMTSGIKWSEDVTEYQLETDDRVKSILSLAQATTPGTSFNYCTANAHLLSAVLTEVGGVSLCMLMHDHLLEPIGITAQHWGRDPKGYFTGGYNFYITPREMLKFGQLCVDKGLFDGQRVVSEAWLREATKLNNNGYGYLFWTTTLRSQQVAMAWGWGGQMVYIIPNLNLTVVFTTNTRNFSQDRFNGMETVKRYVIPAAQ